MVPVRKFSITTSQSATRARASSCPSGVRRSITREALLRLTDWKYVDSPRLHGGPQLRVSSPPSGRSTLTTSAPRSASSMVAYGAARTRLKSAMRTPSSAPAVTVTSEVTGRPRAR